MKRISLLFCLICFFNASSQSKSKVMSTSIHQFSTTTLEGDNFDFSSLKGKKVMVVNTASKCGLTPQYKDLQALYEQFEDQNFVIVGFPANNFMGQEPGSNEEIAQFCERNYGVSFPMMQKISVKGKNMHPIYQFLTQEAKNGKTDSDVEWNFQKYLINEKGELEKVISPKTNPMDAEILDWIKA